MKRYVTQNGIVILFFLLAVLFYGSTFFLYHLPLAAVLYPTGLCVLAALVLLLVSMLSRRRLHRQLSALKGLPGELLFDLPKARNLPEEDYQELLCQVREEMRRQKEEATLRLEDRVEYYTTWVHQIKTPIAAMRLKLAGEDSSLSRELKEELFRIEQYVGMVLCYLRLDSEATDYVIEEYPVDRIVRQALRNYAGQFIRRGLTLVYEEIPDRVVTDEKWLLFVVEQVLSNAIKYTPSGSIEIRSREPGVLCIKDTGIGIAKEDLPRVFEKGYTGYNGRKDKRASGLGLYLCRRILTRLGHTMTLTSEPGKGTEVTLDLRQNRARLE